MKYIQQIHYQVLTWDELPEDEKLLLESANLATQTAYAPYSNFQVGAAVLLESGEVFIGNNQENRAYPSGMCAERTALFQVGALGKGKLVRKIAIRAVCEKHPVYQPITPCGACRQVMAEYEEIAETPFVILMMGEIGEVLRVEGVKSSLLPFLFHAKF